MKVLMVVGSPHKEGCVYTALCEVASALNTEGIDTDFFWIGNKPIGGCRHRAPCRNDRDLGSDKQVFRAYADAHHHLALLEHGLWRKS